MIFVCVRVNEWQVPCIKLLFSHGCDMLNLVDWLKWKGPGIPEELLADDEHFFRWYSYICVVICLLKLDALLTCSN